MDDASRFQIWLSTRACASTAWLPSDPSLARNGLGAIMVGTRLTFALALGRNATVAFPVTRYANTRVCSKSTLGCYFAAPCRSGSEPRQVRRVSVKWSRSPDPLFFWQAAQLSRPRNVRWLNAQFSRYLFDPLPHVRASIDRLQMPIGCLAVHLRGTDKMSEDKRVQNMSLDKVARVVRTIIRFESTGPVSLSSDSDVTVERMRRLLRPVSIWTPPQDWFGSTADSVNERNRLLTIMRRRDIRDEGVALIAVMFGLASCDTLFALSTSNFAIIVQDLSDGHFIEFGGRPYCGVGGSFCA